MTHGWNFTLEESFALYEGYRTALQPLLTEVQAVDAGFQPFFIFVAWNSVTRPTSDVVRSVLPFQAYDWMTWPFEVVDTVAFHFPSSWGESQDAMRIALGAPIRWHQFDPRLEQRARASGCPAKDGAPIGSEYQLMRELARKRADQ